METLDDKTLGEVIRNARLNTDLSLRDLAKLIEKAPSYLSDIENDRRVPAEEVIRDIASQLSLDFDELMARAGRFGEEAERYMKRHPAAGMLFRRISQAHLRHEDLHRLLQEADRLDADHRERED